MDYVRSLKYYGFMQFLPCIADYPFPGAPVLVSIGNYELTIRLQTGSSHPSTSKGGGIFKVTRMRCWRITTLHDVSGFKSQVRHITLSVLCQIYVQCPFLPVEW